MALILCMDGLAGCPEVTFKSLKELAEAAGHTVILIPVEDIETHDDRVEKVITWFTAVTFYYHGQDIILVGQSAGGSAVRIAAKKLENKSSLKGVILMSQAMPLFIPFLTGTLVKCMVGRIIDLIFGRDMDLSEAEHAQLIQPCEHQCLLEAVRARVQVPGKEARKLAFWPPEFKPYSVPTLNIWGDQDRWISPRAQQKLYNIMQMNGMCVEKYEVEGAGHLTLGSVKRDEVVNKILDWVDETIRIDIALTQAVK